MNGVRLAVRFGRGDGAKDLTHQQALRLWEHVLGECGLPILRTEGRAPRPRFALAAPLPPGYTSEAEWLEMYLSERTDVIAALNSCLPEGLRALEVKAMPDPGPSLQSQLRWAEYRISAADGSRAEQLEDTIERFFARESFPWEETIEGRSRRFDLRALADDLWVEQSEGGVALGMRLDASTNGTGRPDSALAGLGFVAALSKHRTKLLFSYLPDALLLWRRIGRFENPRTER